MENSDRGNVVIRLAVAPDDHTLGVSPGNTDVFQSDPHHLRFGRDDENQLAGAFRHHPGGRHLASLVRSAEGPHALAASGVARITGQGGALAVTPLADDQQVAVGRHRAHGDDLVFVQQPDAPHAAGGPGTGGQSSNRKLDCLTLLGDHDHVFGLAHLGNRDQFIALFQVKHDETGGADAGEFSRFQGLYLAFLGGQQEWVLVSGVVDDEHGLNRLSPV